MLVSAQVKSPAGRRVFQVSVRDLIEFVWRAGNLGAESDFASPQRALEGIRGQQRIQKNRPEGYEKEVAVEFQFPGERFELKLRGRIDGVWRQPEGIRLEEIKTLLRPSQSGADPLHWAQLRLYGALFLQGEAVDPLRLQLTYLYLETGEVCEHHASATREELTAFLNRTLDDYGQWLDQYCRWLDERDEAIRRMVFPFAQYRPGQRPMAVAIYRTLRRSGKIFIEAPTGIGKTMAALFPAVKCLPEGRFDKIFYLTAKTTGQTVVAENLQRLRAGGLRLRSLALTAKEKICPLNPGMCEMGNCPRALGYYDRIRPALREALTMENLRGEDLQVLSARHEVCPFELSLDAARWFDLIVGDYNYAFDPRVSLKRFFGEDASAHILLVDEAHNLADRAREMFSAQLSQADLASGRRGLKEAAPALAKALQRVRRAWLQWRRQLAPVGAVGTGDATEAEFAGELEGHDPQPLLFGAPPARKEAAHGPERPQPSQRPPEGLRISTALPESVMESLRHFRREAEEWLIRESAAPDRAVVRQLYFTALDFLRTAEHFDGCSRVVDQWGSLGERLRLFCVDPSRRLAEAISPECAQVFFSGTLTPLEFHRQILGGAETDPCLQLSSPFPPQHLAVLVHEQIGTALRLRQGTFAAVSESIAAFIGERRGNYLVFFPSYHYLEQVRERFCAKHSEIACLGQVPGMTEEARATFLAQFAQSRDTTLVGFAVMGGIFGESIDLVGERLTGAVVVGVGLPQLSWERDLIRDYYDHAGGMGFAYAYRYPGMNRVLQAAGRVIRSETDRGGVLLIDQRFRQAQYRQLLPRGWHRQTVRSGEDIQRVLRRFWATDEGVAPA